MDVAEVVNTDQCMKLSMWQEVPGRFKDFVTHPKPNGYQSIHTNMWLPNGRLVEVQIRTVQMHERAERGVAAHHLYRAAQLGGASEHNMQLAHVSAALRASRALPPAPGSGETMPARQRALPAAVERTVEGVQAAR